MLNRVDSARVRLYTSAKGYSPSRAIAPAEKRGSLKNTLSTILIGLAAVCAFAQSDRGIITGTVADPTGAFIPAAQIVLTNADNGYRAETVTTATGNYTLPALP